MLLMSCHLMLEVAAASDERKRSVPDVGIGFAPAAGARPRRRADRELASVLFFVSLSLTLTWGRGKGGI